MSLKACGINPALGLSPQRRELKPQGTLDFPCAGYAEHYAPDPAHSLPWHWHDEFEVIYILSGQLTVETPGAQYHLTEGDCIAVNAGVLHSANTATACEIRSVVFGQSLITGGKDTVFAKKYITPLAGCRAFRAYAFDRQAEAAVIDSFVAACGALAAEGPGFEFEVRARLSAVCLALCRHFAPDFAAGRTKPNQDEARIQQMLAFIQEHFDRPLTLAEIASAAGIGERECLRCFGKTIHIPPMQYLLKYRIMPIPATFPSSSAVFTGAARGSTGTGSSNKQSRALCERDAALFFIYCAGNVRAAPSSRSRARLRSRPPA